MLLATERTADTALPGQNGLADLTLERRAGRTRMARCRTRPPLHVQQALYPDDDLPDMAYVFLANPTGGLLQNDRHSISVQVGTGARAHVTTQSATKIFTMTEGTAEQTVRLSVASGGYLEYMPDPLIPYREASLVQEVAITLEPGAALLFREVITPGRMAMGEAFQYSRLSNRLTVSGRNGSPVYREAFDLVPNAGKLFGRGVLGSDHPGEPGDTPGRTLGSALVLCDTQSARAVLDQVRHSLPTCPGVRAGASVMPDANGVGIKLVGSDCAAVQGAMQQIWATVRRVLLDAGPAPLRKY